MVEIDHCSERDEQKCLFRSICVQPSKTKLSLGHAWFLVNEKFEIRFKLIRFPRKGFH